MMNWHVARTEPSKGLLAEQSIKALAIEVFLPKTREERKWSRGRVNEVIKPLVNGYIFVNFDSNEDGWQKINDARGVAGLMYSAPERPARIPEKEMLPLFGMCEDGFVPLTKAKQFIFSLGMIAKVIEGPFAGFAGKVKEATTSNVLIEANIFGRLTPVKGKPVIFEPVA